MSKPSSQKTTLSDSVCNLIRRDVQMHILEPGQKINLKELSVRYGVSETPVRIALNRLISENLIEMFPRQGMRIKPLNIDGCRETFEMRRMMELYYSDKMTMVYAIDAEFRRSLEDNINSHYEVANSIGPDSSLEDFLEYYRYDTGFHELLISCAGNNMLMRTYSNLNPFLYTNYIYDKQSKERLITGVEEHRAVLEALKTGDVEKVREKIARHMDNATGAIMTILKRGTFSPQQ